MKLHRTLHIFTHILCINTPTHIHTYTNVIAPPTFSHPLPTFPPHLFTTFPPPPSSPLPSSISTPSFLTLLTLLPLPS